MRPTLMRLITAAALAMLCAASAACGTDGAKVFGAHAEPCPAAVIGNAADDRQKIDDGADCFMAEFEAGRPVIWDVISTTTEGDPIPTRYEFDGETVTVTTDSSFDTFGDGQADQEDCDGVRRSDLLPEGFDCIASSGDGFRPDSLPGRG